MRGAREKQKGIKQKEQGQRTRRPVGGRLDETGSHSWRERTNPCRYVDRRAEEMMGV